MSKVALEEKERKIAEIKLPVMDCECMDNDTRKTVIYLIGKELKYLRSFPGDWVQGQEANLSVLKERIEKCTLESGPKSKKGRRLSKYQQFMKVCATGTEKGGLGKVFKECVVDWRETRGKGVIPDEEAE